MSELIFPGVTEENLISRAIRNARIPRRVDAYPRWVAVKHAFALGSGFAQELCRVFGFDPDEVIR